MILVAETSVGPTLYVLASEIRFGGLGVDQVLRMAAEAGVPYAQLVRADLLVGPLHACIASATAYRRHGGGRGAARSPAMELLLRLAGERQVSRAIDKLGVAPGSTHACLVAVSPRRDLLEGLLRALGDRVSGECRWGGARAAAENYGFNPDSCASTSIRRCAEIHAGSMAVAPEVSWGK